MKHKYIITALTIIAISVIFYATSQVKPQSSQINTTGVNTVEDFRMVVIDGNERNLSDWKGKIIILNFWATWCPPCLREIPAMIKMQAKWQQNNIQFIGVSLDDPDKVKQFAQEKGLNYPNFLGTAFHIAISRDLGNETGILPYTVIINPDFKVIYTHSGEITETVLKKALKKFDLPG
uniref:Peroxiredoxin n=1 Tax=Candidatus Kentrum sp. SD TaxID=2126332 RepID=A0A451BSN5_9GAMM|nr:MAG: Peroxiredoxin [Candidatus Kentron sp. SD]